jgi:hypothetical protein
MILSYIGYFLVVIGVLFLFLGALGILELRYDEPSSQYDNISLKGQDYISFWDGLKYIRFTQLGLYTLGIIDKYEISIDEDNKFELKFDEYKPIITVDKNDTVTIAKLEPFTVAFDSNRYILNHSKVFRDCDSIKALKLKIDSFYENIEKNPPKIFKDFFSTILKNANSLKQNSDEIVIEIKNNKKLLSLFLTNKKLQELIIKASQYRVIVMKKDLSKFTKIVKENGFFINF